LITNPLLLKFVELSVYMGLCCYMLSYSPGTDTFKNGGMGVQIAYLVINIPVTLIIAVRFGIFFESLFNTFWLTLLIVAIHLFLSWAIAIGLVLEIFGLNIPKIISKNLFLVSLTVAPCLYIITAVFIIVVFVRSK